MANRDDQLRQVIKIARQDPGFSKLNPQAQDRLVMRLMESKFGAIQKSESLLSRATRDIKSVADRAINSASGGLYEGAGQLGDMTGNFLSGQGFNRDGMPPVLTQPATPAGKFVGDIAGIAGTLAGGPGAVANKLEASIARQVPGALGKYGGKIAGGVSLGALSPGTMEERATGGAIGGLTNPLISKGAELLKKPAIGMINSIFKPGNILKTRPTFGEDILSKGLTGSEDDIIQKSGDLVNSSENKLQGMIVGQKQKANFGTMIDQLKSLKSEAIRNADDAMIKDIDRVEEMLVNRIDDVNVQESTQFSIPKGSESVQSSPSLVKEARYEPTGFEIKPGSTSKITKPELNVRTTKEPTGFQMKEGTIIKPKKVIVEKKNYGDFGEELPSTKKASIVEEQTTQTRSQKQESFRTKKEANIQETETQYSSPGYSSRTSKKLPSKVGVVNKQTAKASPGYEGPETSVTKTVKDPNRLGSLDEANKLKRSLYGETPAKEYGEYTENPYLRTALGLKDEVEKALPDMPIKQTNADIGLGSEAKRLMEKRAISNSGKSPLSLTDAVLGGLGIASSDKDSSPLERILKGVSLVALKKSLSSTKVRAGLAQLLYNISKQSGNIGKLTTASVTNRQPKEK